jgi:hypothetical protein
MMFDLPEIASFADEVRSKTDVRNSPHVDSMRFSFPAQSDADEDQRDLSCHYVPFDANRMTCRSALARESARWLQSASRRCCLIGLSIAASGKPESGRPLLRL